MVTDDAASATRKLGIPDAETERAVRAFMTRLEGRYPAVRAVLFGSRARGTYEADSDADLAVVLKGNQGDRTAAALDMAGVALEILLETGVLVEALPLWEDEFAEPAMLSNPDLLETIRREGLPL